MLELEQARELLLEMGIKTAADLLDAHLETAVKEETTYLTFLTGLLNCEKEERKLNGVRPTHLTYLLNP